MNKNLFRAMHTAHGDTQKQVADYIGITEQTLSAKVNGETDFTCPEAEKVRNSLFPGMRMEYLFHPARDGKSA